MDTESAGPSSVFELGTVYGNDEADDELLMADLRFATDDEEQRLLGHSLDTSNRKGKGRAMKETSDDPLQRRGGRKRELRRNLPVAVPRRSC